jgi:hypothetical protein
MEANRSARLERSALECADMAAKVRDPRAKDHRGERMAVARAAAKLSRAMQRGRRPG